MCHREMGGDASQLDSTSPEFLPPRWIDGIPKMEKRAQLNQMVRGDDLIVIIFLFQIFSHVNCSSGDCGHIGASSAEYKGQFLFLIHRRRIFFSISL